MVVYGVGIDCFFASDEAVGLNIYVELDFCLLLDD